MLKLKLEESECKNNVKVMPGWYYKLLSDEGLFKKNMKNHLQVIWRQSTSTSCVMSWFDISLILISFYLLA